MDCRDIDNLFDAWLDGELDPERSAVIKQHIETCEQCALEYAAFLQALAAPPEIAVPDGLRDRIVSAIDRPAEIVITNKRQSFRFLPWTMATAACIAFFAAGFWASNLSKQDKPILVVEVPEVQPTQGTPTPAVFSPWMAVCWTQTVAIPSPVSPFIFMTQAMTTELIATQPQEMRAQEMQAEWCPPVISPHIPIQEPDVVPTFPIFVPLQRSLGV